MVNSLRSGPREAAPDPRREVKARLRVSASRSIGGPVPRHRCRVEGVRCILELGEISAVSLARPGDRWPTASPDSRTGAIRVQGLRSCHVVSFATLGLLRAHHHANPRRYAPEKWTRRMRLKEFDAV